MANLPHDDQGPGFDDVVPNLDALLALYRAPSALVQRKKVGHLDDTTRAFIASSPFVLMATADAEGRCDVSPRGGPPGFVKALDAHRLVLPDLNGNNLIDSLRNLVANPHIGMLFVVPGHDETLRVEGRAVVTTSAAVLDLFAGELRRPVTAIGITVEAAFIHCAKSFRRGRVWDPASWSELTAPSAAEVLRCQLDLDVAASVITTSLEEGYVADLAADRPLP